MVPNWFEGELNDYVCQSVYNVVSYIRPFFNEKSVEKVLCRGTADKKFTLLIFAYGIKHSF